jgi:hypothetical protein
LQQLIDSVTVVRRALLASSAQHHGHGNGNGYLHCADRAGAQQM